eukprot:TRINITY_DN13612_c0_g1_i1.p1 TRINITY_DN13612_c0_g1~~TRINITY_DN13612_c0_g1_i1.p1  ORF type:complete len:239 (+),score=52.77 TRINITY_DN13612_c0_g1_i1:99-719(+)
MATLEHCIYCFDSLLNHFEPNGLGLPTFENGKYPLFVTWLKEGSNPAKEPSLRGCKGTFGALDLHKGLRDYSLISALKDTRFSPITHKEVGSLHCGVSLLFQFEDAKSVWDWEVGVHGIIIEWVHDGEEFSATYLPEVAEEQEWDHEETLHSLIRKAGYNGRITTQLLEKIALKRYQSSKIKMTYKEYKQHKQQLQNGVSKATVKS